MAIQVKLTIIESRCRAQLHRKGEEFIVDDTCPPICHELWQCMYPQVYTLLNGGTLDYGESRAQCFECACPDQRRVLVKGEILDGEE